MTRATRPQPTRLELFLPGRRRLVVTLRGLRPEEITTVPFDDRRTALP